MSPKPAAPAAVAAEDITRFAKLAEAASAQPPKRRPTADWTVGRSFQRTTILQINRRPS
ncbi:MAG: hypothetical protein ACTS53_01860 [Candidatus Hodgkinia cicadicola]